MLKPFKHVDLISLMNFPEYAAPEENGLDFRENAVLKAVHAAQHLQKLVLADDSGLVVPALAGAPGTYSRRYAGDESTDAENRKKLLKEMLSFKDLQRAAYFECCLALADSQGLKKCVTGTCEGVLLDEEKGRNGFGYDSLFVKNDYDKTFGEIEESVKNRISHRRKAFDKIAVYLEGLPTS